ncbi:MAG: flavoprotein [Armatimonadota bacterium]|nr:flavoprotein [Armatimonadota bacterium]MDR7445369.1 flavoprotein [Armatimonadota bacterium]MDR7569744.1 flavoprotein [Armatimonadota bacterium]MDR7614102.1 flavoprotein [Armatimonadota bacterium]
MTGPCIVVGVCGGIAAYKVAYVVSALRREGAEVHVVMTRAARRFVGSATFRALSANPVITDLWAPTNPHDEPHVALGTRADLVLVAPATAHTLAKLACGLADDPVCATVLATKAPVLLAPAMSEEMWQHPATRRNVETLQGWGYRFVGPVYGRLASGQEGWGRMAEPGEILAAIRELLRSPL